MRERLAEPMRSNLHGGAQHTRACFAKSRDCGSFPVRAPFSLCDSSIFTPRTGDLLRLSQVFRRTPQAAIAMNRRSSTRRNARRTFAPRAARRRTQRDRSKATRRRLDRDPPASSGASRARAVKRQGVRPEDREDSAALERRAVVSDDRARSYKMEDRGLEPLPFWLPDNSKDATKT